MSLVRAFAKAKKKAQDNRAPTDAQVSSNAGEAGSSSGSGMLVVNVESINKQVASVESKRRRRYTAYSDGDRYQIGKYASENGTNSALRKYKSSHTGLTESTISRKEVSRKDTSNSWQTTIKKRWQRR